MAHKSTPPPPPPRAQRKPRRAEPQRVGKPPVAPGSSLQAPANSLPLPHERDESATGQTDPDPAPVIVQAQADLTAGQVDTDLRASPGLDAARRQELLRRSR